MDQQRRSLLVARLVAGFSPARPGGSVYRLHDPTAAARLEAEEAHAEALSEAVDLLSDAAAEALAESDGVWGPVPRKDLGRAEQDLEDLKVALFESFHDGPKRTEIREQISRCRSRLAALLDAKWRYRDQTAASFAAARKARVLAGLSLFTPAGARAFGDDWRLWADDGVLDAVVESVAASRPSEAELRELARTTPWQGYWAVGKPNPFGGAAASLSEDRLALCNFGLMYDQVQESSERPPRDVIEDDDALDGWLILQRRKAGRDDREEVKRKMIGSDRVAACKEVFVMARSPEEIESIEGWNDFEGKREKAARNNVIRSKGMARDMDFPDVRNDLTNQAMDAQLKNRS